MPTHKSSDYKLSAVKYYLSHSKNQVQTCKIFGCSERSLMRWVDKYKSTNNITRKKRDYSSYKITNSHISFIKQQLKQNKTLTIDELLTKLKNKYPDLTLSRVHLGRVVRDINITLKQTRLRHVPKTRYKKPIVIKKDNNLLYAVPYQHYTNAIEGYFNVLKSRLQKKKGLTYDELVNNVKDVLDEIPIHIYKNLIKGAYDRSEKYVKRPSTRKRKPKKYLD
jgi:transposase